MYFYGGKTNDYGGCISSVYLGFSHVVHVEPDAFQGTFLLLFDDYLNLISNYSFTNVDFVSNSLKRFEEGVFKSILQDLSISHWEFLDVRDSMYLLITTINCI